MANKKNKKKTSSKKTVKKVVKAAKKNPKTFAVLFTILVLAVIGIVVLWKLGYISFGEKNKESEKTYTFEKDTNCYALTYNSLNGCYIVGEKEELIKDKYYLLAKEDEGVLSLYILDGSEIKTEEVLELPKEVTASYVWTYQKEDKGSLVFKKNVYSGIAKDVIFDDFQIHFMMMGNDAAGDAIYIKAGDNDILIDAGSKSGSFATTDAYVKNYCKDNKLEYVIATHGDQDHIAAFPKFFQNFAVDTVIDFTGETYTQFEAYKTKLKEDSKALRDYFVTTTKSTDTYGEYLKARDSKAKNHYTAGDCYLNKNGGKRSYALSSNVTMDILYNYYYYDNNNDGKPDSDDENNFSVLTLFTYQKNGESHRFFLGGDLEKDGEEKFASYYDGTTKEKTMLEVDLYKAGHHGSKTSSNDCLLNILKPRLCVVCCCCGTDEYTGNTDNQFPTQDFINRIAKWTEDVYVTTIYDTLEIKTALANAKGKTTKTGVEVGKQYIHTSGFKAMNGNIIVSSNGTAIGLYASNNLIKLKDSEWFNSQITLDGVSRKMRVWPSA